MDNELVAIAYDFSVHVGTGLFQAGTGRSASMVPMLALRYKLLQQRRRVRVLDE